MLSFADTCPRIWRNQVQIVADTYFGGSLEKFADAAKEWEIEQGGSGTVDYYKAYLKSIDKNRGKTDPGSDTGLPMISADWRKYAAHCLGLRVAEHEPPKVQPVVSKPKKQEEIRGSRKPPSVHRPQAAGVGA